MAKTYFNCSRFACARFARYITLYSNKTKCFSRRCNDNTEKSHQPMRARVCSLTRFHICYRECVCVRGHVVHNLCVFVHEKAQVVVPLSRSLRRRRSNEPRRGHNCKLYASKWNASDQQTQSNYQYGEIASIDSNCACVLAKIYAEPKNAYA